MSRLLLGCLTMLAALAASPAAARAAEAPASLAAALPPPPAEVPARPEPNHIAGSTTGTAPAPDTTGDPRPAASAGTIPPTPTEPLPADALAAPIDTATPERPAPLTETATPARTLPADTPMAPADTASPEAPAHTPETATPARTHPADTPTAPTDTATPEPPAPLPEIATPARTLPADTPTETPEALTASDPLTAIRPVTLTRPVIPGTVLVDVTARRLIVATGTREGLSFPVTTARPGIQFLGETHVTLKRRDPTWTPTPNQRRLYRGLPGSVGPGHPENPLGSRALNLAIGHLRIHGTNEPHEIGEPTSDGCIRLINAHIEQVFELVPVGARVIVTRDLDRALEGRIERVVPRILAGARVPRRVVSARASGRALIRVSSREVRASRPRSRR